MSTTTPPPPTDPHKAVLLDYLRRTRTALWWKLDGLDEAQVRMPCTPTGLSLLGTVKHCLNVEAGYFGATFGRPWPAPEELVADDHDVDPQADWYATADETRDGLLDLARRVAEFSDAVIAELPLDAPGRVPWWPAERAEVTLQQVIVHVLVDMSRHAGQVDVVREGIDGAAGMLPHATNLPDGTDWASYRRRLEEIAGRFR